MIDGCMSTQPGRKDAPVVADGAGVTFVMPVLNERAYLRRAVETVLAQDVDGADRADPGSRARRPTARPNWHASSPADDRIVLVDNPEADIPIGLNRAIRAGPLPDDRPRRRALRARAGLHDRVRSATLDRVRAANVGGVMKADGRTPFQRAVARAYNSPIGLGGGAYHGGTQEGEAESAYLGVMRRDVLDEVGLFDESIRRGEDWELNLRIRRAGYRVWFDPALAVTYWPRESWTRLVRQFSATGRWRGELVRRYGRGNSRALLRAARARRHPRRSASSSASCRRPECSPGGGRSRHPSSICR